MVVLDTDHVSILEWESGADYHCLGARLEHLSANEVATTIVSYDEQTRGWLAYIAKARKFAQLVEGYRRLHRHLDVYCSMLVLDFDESAAVVLQGIRHLQTRIGAFDLRIAAITLSRGATLLTRNQVDFERVPGLRFEDWTKPE
jgi:tRNA(fMet)-specific endonuclease VapC